MRVLLGAQRARHLGLGRPLQVTLARLTVPPLTSLGFCLQFEFLLASLLELVDPILATLRAGARVFDGLLGRCSSGLAFSGAELASLLPPVT